jgi:hypothetical protein
MSAPAPALAAAPKPIVKVRLADVANAGACVSLMFSLLLVVSPAFFPDLIIESWFDGRLTAGMLLFALLFNCALYERIARLRFAKTDPLAFLAIGLGTAITVICFSLIFPAIALMTQLREQAHAHEEVLALAYFAVVAAVFSPFLIIRFTQDLRKKTTEV